jgi:hypothetical protein
VTTRRAVLARFGVLAAGFVAAGAGDACAQAVDRKAARDAVVQGYAFSHFSASDRDRKKFGKLTFLGGLELRSKDPEFGGISSGVIDPDGRGFLAISDHGHWISGRFVEQAGVLSGVEGIRIAPMIAPDGRRLKDTRYFDSEGLARQGSSVFVSVERTHDILQFDLGARGFGARGRLIEVPAGMKGLDSNRGVEALGVLPKESTHAGALIALAEKAPKSAASRNNPGWILGPRGGALNVRKIGDFDITDLSFLPGGDMLILERRFVPFFGLGFRIRRIPIAMVRPGALLDGEVLIEADLSQQIDNMEVLMVHRAANGRTILTVMSDDNFSMLQRTLVLRFALDE